MLSLQFNIFGVKRILFGSHDICVIVLHKYHNFRTRRGTFCAKCVRRTTVSSPRFPSLSSLRFPGLGKEGKLTANLWFKLTPVTTFSKHSPTVFAHYYPFESRVSSVRFKSPPNSFRKAECDPLTRAVFFVVTLVKPTDLMPTRHSSCTDSLSAPRSLSRTLQRT